MRDVLTFQATYKEVQDARGEGTHLQTESGA